MGASPRSPAVVGLISPRLRPYSEEQDAAPPGGRGAPGSPVQAAGGRARQMSGSTIFKLADAAPVEAGKWPGPPPLSMQQLWFTIQRLQWASLVVVPADGNSAAADFGRPLYEVGKLAMGDRLRLLDARELKTDKTASLILDMTGANRPHNAGSPEWSERVLVMVESVLTAPSAIPVALAADAAILGVELGKTSLAGARETIALLGAHRFLGCVTVPPP